jgi:hypothetical protein
MKKQHNLIYKQKETSINKRIFSLDILKAISIMAVVSCHSVFVPRSSYQPSAFQLEILFSPLRFCVPILFTISFFLLSRDLEKNSGQSLWQLLKNRLQRLAKPTIFWFVLAFSLRLLNKGNILNLVSRILSGTIFQGSYFLIALLEMTPFFICLNKKILNPMSFLSALFAQVLVFSFIQYNLFFDNRSEVIEILKLIDRPFFIYWFVYMFLGAFIWKNWTKVVDFSDNISITTKCMLCVFGFTGIILEKYYLFKASLGNIQPFDYAMISCILITLILFACCASIQEDQIPVFLRTLVLAFSRYSLGIFCINGILSEILLSIGSHLFKNYMFSLPEVLIIKLIGWPVLLFSCLGISMLLDKLGLRAIVQ